MVQSRDRKTRPEADSITPFSSMSTTWGNTEGSTFDDVGDRRMGCGQRVELDMAKEETKSQILTQ